MRILKWLYGTDTRNVRIYNLGFHSIWLVLCISHIHGVLEMDFPNAFEPRITTVVWLQIACIVTSIVSLVPMQYVKNRELYKYISLLLGALIEFIVAYKYVTVYPPLNPMVIVSTQLGFWFLGGALFVKYEKHEKKVKNDSANGAVR